MHHVFLARFFSLNFRDAQKPLSDSYNVKTDSSISVTLANNYPTNSKVS